MATGNMKLAAANRGAIERWEETFGRRRWLGRETGKIAEFHWEELN